MHIKAHAGKGLSNADIEEIVTNISTNPQSWRYISFSTAERSPKCNSTQEKSPSEQCIHTGKWKQHQDTLDKLFYFSTSVHHLESFQLKLEPQLHKLGPINGFFPWWWRYACAGLKLELIPFHIFHIWVGLGLGGDYEISFVNHLYLLNGKLHNVPHSKSSTTQHPNLPSSFLPPAYKTFASINGANLSAEQRWISGSLIWMIVRAPGPSAFVFLILNSQPNLLLPFLGRSFLCPPILSDLANVDLVDDQPSN